MDDEQLKEDEELIVVHSERSSTNIATQVIAGILFASTLCFLLQEAVKHAP